MLKDATWGYIRLREVNVWNVLILYKVEGSEHSVAMSLQGKFKDECLHVWVMLLKTIVNVMLNVLPIKTSNQDGVTEIVE